MPALKKALASETPFVRKYAARALGNAKDGTDALIKALSDKNADVRREAVWSLALIGSGARKSESALKKALGDVDYVVRYAAAEALRKIK